VVKLLELQILLLMQEQFETKNRVFCKFSNKFSDDFNMSLGI
jgi:hypothetical protein